MQNQQSSRSYDDEEYLYGHSDAQHHHRFQNSYSSSDDSSSLLFQSIQISIPILPFMTILCLIFLLILLRMIKFSQWAINWQIIAKSFRHQVVLLSLFVEIPLLIFYLFALIKHGKKDWLLAVVLLLNGMFSGLLSFLQEKTLGFLVSLMGCFITSLVIDEAHVRTILLCLCFVLVVMKIRKIMISNKKMESEQWIEKNLRFKNVRFENESYSSSHDSRDNGNSLRNRFEKYYYRGSPSQIGGSRYASSHLSDTLKTTDEYAPLNTLYDNDEDDNVNEMRTLENASSERVNGSSIMNFFRNFLPNRTGANPSKQQQQPDILERKAVKLQRPTTAYERYLNSRNQPIKAPRENSSNERSSSTSSSLYSPTTTTTSTTLGSTTSAFLPSRTATLQSSRPSSWSMSSYSRPTSTTTSATNNNNNTTIGTTTTSVTTSSRDYTSVNSMMSTQAAQQTCLLGHQPLRSSPSSQAPSIQRFSFNNRQDHHRQEEDEEEEFIPSSSTLDTAEEDEDTSHNF
nr:unnamed protein product [Naegleria fowleri]